MLFLARNREPVLWIRVDCENVKLSTITLSDNEFFFVLCAIVGHVVFLSGIGQLGSMPDRPRGVPQANWLAIPNGQFSLMLLAYGPKWNQQTNPFYPPPIQVLP